MTYESNWHDHAIAHLESAIQLLRTTQKREHLYTQAIIDDLQCAKQGIMELKNLS
jgi:hypothetical protein